MFEYNTEFNVSIFGTRSTRGCAITAENIKETIQEKFKVLEVERLPSDDFPTFRFVTRDTTGAPTEQVERLLGQKWLFTLNSAPYISEHSHAPSDIVAYSTDW